MLKKAKSASTKAVRKYRSESMVTSPHIFGRKQHGRNKDHSLKVVLVCFSIAVINSDQKQPGEESLFHLTSYSPPFRKAKAKTRQLMKQRPWQDNAY